MSIVSKGFKYIFDGDCRFRVNAAQGMYRKMDDAVFLKRYYKARTGREIDLDHPKSFNEKLQWLKLHDRNPRYSELVDKAEVKRYVAEMIGEEHVIPTYGVWDKYEDIDFASLPAQFVLKCTHDSHSVYICKDKKNFNFREAKRQINRALGKNYYYQSREWPYKNVKPRVLAEKYMVDESGVELKDYKVLCFNGEPKLIELHQGRFAEKHYQDFYDLDWRKTTICNLNEEMYPDTAPKPICFDEMMEHSRMLAKNIPHVRVDWYVVGSELYFGELTFYDGSGFDLFKDDRDDLMIGSWITVI